MTGFDEEADCGVYEGSFPKSPIEVIACRQAGRRRDHVLVKRNFVMKHRDSLDLMKRTFKVQRNGQSVRGSVQQSLPSVEDRDLEQDIVASQQARLALARRCLKGNLKHSDSLRNLSLLTEQESFGSSLRSRKVLNDELDYEDSNTTEPSITETKRKRREKYGGLVHQDSLILAHSRASPQNRSGRVDMQKVIACLQVDYPPR